MAYTLNSMLLDLGSWYAAVYPTLNGRFFAPPPITGSTPTPIDTATNSPTSPVMPLSLSFMSAAVPPTSPFTVHVVDTGTGGDIFRSGTISSLPPSPGNLTIITAPTTTINAATLNAMIGGFAPPAITIPAGVGVVSGILTLGTLIPLSATIISIVPVSGGTPLTFTVTGTVTSQRFWFFTVTTTFTYTFTMSLTPSGDSVNRTRTIAVTVPASGLGGNTLTPLLNFLVAPFLGIVLAGFAEPALNGIIASNADTELASMGFRLSPTATVSARGIVVTPSGIAAQIAISDVFGPGVLPLPKVLAVSILPDPSTSSNVPYKIKVRNAATGMAVPGATITLKNFTQSGTSQTLTTTSDATGEGTITTTLHGKITFGIRIVDGERERVRFFTPPNLRVSATGFNPVELALLEDIE
jgi:hypothetical protein